MFGDIKLDLEAIDSAIKSCAGPRGNPECLSGPFQSLRGMTSSKGADYLKGSKQVRSTLLKYSELVECIQADLCNVLKACAWIEHIDSVKSGADEETAVLFTKSLEVCLHAFHVEFRSISDYVAGIVLRLNGQKVDLDMVSFKQVLDWLANATQKPVELAGLINELRTFVPFYRDIAHIRNAIVHKGADAFAVLADPSIHGRLGFGILVKKRDRLMTLGSMPTSLFEIGVIDLKIYLGLAIGFMINFLNRFSASVMSILNGREIICLEESVHPFFPSTMAKLIAVAGLKNSLHMMKNFSCPGTVPQMIAAGRPLAEILKLVNDMEPIRVSKMKYVGAYAPGSTSAIKFMTEARGYLELQLHT